MDAVADESAAIRIVLVDTSHPGNIGAAARAMKNMELDELVLVRPRQFPHPEATARASGADDVLARRARGARRWPRRSRAAAWSLATTSRERDQYFRVLDVREAARARSCAEARARRSAVLFGAERTGLTNEELAPAHAADPHSGRTPNTLRSTSPWPCRWSPTSCSARAAPRCRAGAARSAARDAASRWSASTRISSRCWRRSTSAIAPRAARNLMARIRRFLQRAELDQNEVNILRGMLTAVQSRRRRAGEQPQ